MLHFYPVTIFSKTADLICVVFTILPLFYTRITLLLFTHFHNKVFNPSDEYVMYLL